MDKHDYIVEEERAYIVHTDDDLEDHEENSNSDNKSSGMLREQDRFLPIANIAKVMKRAVPDNAKIAKDARECVQECLSEFVSFITSEASDFCQTEKRKTINGEDILHAMHTLGFDNYVEPLKVYLKKYRETISGQYPNTSKIVPSNPEPADSIQIEIDANDEFTMNLLRNDQGTTYIFGKGENI